MLDSNGYPDRPLKADIVKGHFIILNLTEALERHGGCSATESGSTWVFTCERCKMLLDDIIANGFNGIVKRNPGLSVHDGPEKLTARLNAILRCKYLEYDFPF